MKYVLVASGLALMATGALPAMAAVTVSATAAGYFGSTTDAFDVSQGGSVVSSTPVQTNVGPSANAIGGTSATSEPVNLVFADNTSGVQSLTFKTAAPVTIDGIDLLLADDGPTNSDFRGFSSVSLLGSIDGINFTILATADLGTGSYTSTYGSNGITVAANFATVTDQFFRFDGASRLADGANFNGGRVVEIDAVRSATGAVPEPASWAMMVGGFGLMGTAMRRKKASVRFA